MKKNHFFTFVGTLAIALGIVSCTNDDGNYSPNQVEPSNNTTRSVGGMTKEEVEARVDELEKKYNASILIVDTASMTESRFEEMELQMMTTQLEWQNNKDKNIWYNSIRNTPSGLNPGEWFCCWLLKISVK